MPPFSSRAVRAVCAALAAATVVLAAGAPSPAAAQTPTSVPPPPGLPDAAQAHISPELATVRVDSAAMRAAQADFDATNSELLTIQTARLSAETELLQLADRDRTLTEAVSTDTATKKTATVALAKIRIGLRAFAVASYVRGTQTNEAGAETVDEAITIEGDNVVFGTVGDGQRSKERETTAQLTEAVAALNRDLTDRATVRTRTAEVTAARDESAAREATLLTDLARKQIVLDAARGAATVVGSDFTLLALDAYWRAAQTMASAKPACGITWWALAGIGKVEGRHGTYGSAQLLANGDTSAPIVGITLDGTNSTAVIGDTDGGEFDGDALFDHAVGPMQFIPSTWVRWQADGNLDGIKSPNNMYDATLAAAKYLCAGGAMATDQDMTRGYLSYNHSDAYAARVLGWAQFYRDHVTIPPIA